MTRWYPLEAVDAGFFASAPYVFRYQKPFAAAPEQVWESLASADSAAAWGRTVKEVSFTSPPPHGVGTTRESVALGARGRSRYFRWDVDKGYSMYVYESTAPVFTRYAEDFVLQPSGDSTLFTFTVAIEPKARFALPFRVFAPVLKLALGRVVTEGQRYFAAGG
ncbi:SRPBCC family protein [Mycolicibacterium vinylchloridicum]|uniref:SRPBCC family protein n=1 Tax=Mycolicibacterium vinylchloridicum TaxID=2736928 RepID=UPI0015C6A605|nr:SRPBCC family protein [Mycolicibacterium vinylchloridicum]